MFHRFLSFQGEQGDVLFPHDGVQIHPRGIYPLAVDILPAVEHGIENLHPQMGHADFIDVREAHRKAYIHLVRVLDDLVDFSADIAGWLLDTQQDFVT